MSILATILVAGTLLSNSHDVTSLGAWGPYSKQSSGISYINDIDEPKEQKIIDLTNIITLLHNKTTMYKEIDLDNYKYIYEEINRMCYLCIK